MEPLFPGAPQDPPPRRGPTWTVTFNSPPPPAPVRHVAGYAPFVRLAARFGTDARSLRDLWAFAHFVRAHREALEADPELLRAAVVFLGNVLTARWPECAWANGPDGLAVRAERDDPMVRERGPRIWLGVERTVPAILEADEDRFLEFERVVQDWS